MISGEVIEKLRKSFDDQNGANTGRHLYACYHFYIVNGKLKLFNVLDLHGIQYV